MSQPTTVFKDSVFGQKFGENGLARLLRKGQLGRAPPTKRTAISTLLFSVQGKLTIGKQQSTKNFLLFLQSFAFLLVTLLFLDLSKFTGP